MQQIKNVVLTSRNCDNAASLDRSAVYAIARAALCIAAAAQSINHYACLTATAATAATAQTHYTTP
jgi:hypothetical protein